MRRFALLLNGHPARLTLAVLMGAGTIASSIGLLTTAAYLISSAALLPPILDLSIAIVGVRFFGISRGVFRYIERVTSHDVSLRISAGLRSRIARALATVIPGGLGGVHSGDLLVRIISDADAWQHVVTRVVIPPLISVLVVAGIFLFAWLLLPAAALVLLAALLLAGVALPWLAERAGRWSESTTAVDRSRLSTAVGEMIAGASEISAYGSEELFLDEVDALETRVMASELRSSWVTGITDALLLLLIGGTEIAMLAIAIPAVADGRLAGVQLAVVAMLALASFEAVHDLPRAYQSLGSSVAAIDRVEQILTAVRSRTAAATPVPVPEHPTLRLHDIELRYRTRPEPVLLGASLEIPYGSRIALTGPSGSGKTSLAHLLLRFRDPDAGIYTVGGIAATRLDPDQLRARIGLVDDGAFVFTATVRDNLLVGDPAADSGRLLDVCRRAGLECWLARLPSGLETMIDERRISGGEKRRLAIARALLADFDVLVLDEPTAGLDEETAGAVMKDLLAATADRSIVLITHRTDGIDAMERVVMLSAGHLCECR